MFTLIDSIEDLYYLNKELSLKPYVGIDTEFRRTNKYNMKLALLQINDDEEIYLIDTILIPDPKDSCDFLFSDTVIKIFHSCKEDLEAVYAWGGRAMSNLFDTQLANAFLNGDFSISYQGLIKDKFDISINKSETRSNWVRRPLTDSQLDYAASDVEYLVHLYANQKKELIESKKIGWHNEEVQSIIDSTFSSANLEQDLNFKITKSEERDLLFKFNEIVKNIALTEEINPTLFFSKKNQKEFLKLSLNNGIEEASKLLTNWRRDLIFSSLKEIF